MPNSLRDYYKTHVYDYAYNKGYDDGVAKTPHPTGDMHDIYWQDEMDFDLCQRTLKMMSKGGNTNA